MWTSILAGLGFIALSVLISYKLSAAFWKTDYSKTNNTGDFGTPRGGFLATIGGMIISMYLVLSLGRYVIDTSILTWVLMACMISSAVAGFIPLFRYRPLK